MPDWDAGATLHQWTKYKGEGKLGALVNQVMGKRLPDRQGYSIMVGDTIYDAAAIEKLSEQRQKK